MHELFPLKPVGEMTMWKKQTQTIIEILENGLYSLNYLQITSINVIENKYIIQ